MAIVFLYLIALLSLLCFLIFVSFYMLSMIYSHLKGSPYVPSKMREIDYILKVARLKKNQTFYDLGCGDGRVVRRAVQKYRVYGVGVDINPLLIWYSRFLSRMSHLKKAHFYRSDIFVVNLSGVDTVYLFLMPELLTKLKNKLINELKPRTLIISHGFKIEGWKSYLTKTIPNSPFPTYFYTIK